LPPREFRRAAGYSSVIASFLAATDDQVAGELASRAGLSPTPEQHFAWREELSILRPAIARCDGWLHLEYEIPRLGRRIDAVVVLRQASPKSTGEHDASL
jgi:hypothetical protein